MKRAGYEKTFCFVAVWLMMPVYSTPAAAGQGDAGEAPYADPAVATAQTERVPSVSPDPDAPRFVKSGGRATLILPPALERAIQRDFPSARIPKGEEMSAGLWGQQLDGKMPPFAVWGDFDGNGLLDFAAMLLGKNVGEPEFFMQQRPGEYAAAHYALGDPYWKQNAYLRLLRAGETQEIYTCPGTGNPVTPMKFEHDAVVMTDLHGARHLYYWDEGGIRKQDDETECD